MIRMVHNCQCQYLVDSDKAQYNKRDSDTQYMHRNHKLVKMTTLDLGLTHEPVTWYAWAFGCVRRSVYRMYNTEEYDRLHGLHQCEMLTERLLDALACNQNKIDEYREWVHTYSMQLEYARDRIFQRTRDIVSKYTYQAQLRGVTTVPTQDDVMEMFTKEDYQMLDFADGLVHSIEYKKTCVTSISKVSKELRITLLGVKRSADHISLCSHVSNMNTITKSMTPADISGIITTAEQDVTSALTNVYEVNRETKIKPELCARTRDTANSAFFSTVYEQAISHTQRQPLAVSNTIRQATLDVA